MTQPPDSRYAKSGSEAGCKILEQRLSSIPELLRLWLPQLASSTATLAPVRAAGREAFVVTGIGSSEAHARYLATLLSQSGAAAEFRPLSAFLRPNSDPHDAAKVLVVISQGLSPNAWLALLRRKEFRQCFVFSSLSKNGALSRGDKKSAERLDELARDGVMLLHYPLENEFEVLLRVVGPFFGYLLCHAFAGQVSHGEKQGASAIIQEVTLLDTFARAASAGKKLAHLAVSAYREGFHILAPAPLSLYAQNLCLKFQEGLFWQIPRLWDSLDLAHGLLQQLAVAKRPVWLFSSAGDPPELTQAALTLLQSVRVEPLVFTSPLNEPLAILEFELMTSFAVVALIRKTGVNQVDWPGKGLDAAMYRLGAGG